MIDETHDPNLRSWVESANDPSSDFPIQNLPLGIFRKKWELPRVGIAIGDRVLDLAGCAAGAILKTAVDSRWFDHFALNPIMAEGRKAIAEIRSRVSELLREGSPQADAARRCLVPMNECEVLMPVLIGDYTDFYASIHHATNVGSMFRPDNPLLPNYKWVPIGYHGRASSIVISGSPVRRPCGQTREGEAAPVFGPTRRLDYEMEVGFFVASGNELGKSIAIGEAEEHIFGLCLVNDWSARDVQTWEYQPLGPFLAKNFATTISPWVVTMEALEPFRCEPYRRPEGDPQPLPHLTCTSDRTRGGIDLTVEVWIATKKMRDDGVLPVRLSRGPFREMYWTIAQMLAHHTSNGCNVVPGDLIASGTVSGTTKDSRGSLLELSWRGTEPVELPTGETRQFLEDEDEVIMRGYCERDGFARIGFGECRGRVLPAVCG